MNILIPLRKENVSYEVYGVQTAIETYFWDFYGAGLRMLSAEAWAMATEFIRAQNNVLSEFRQNKDYYEIKHLARRSRRYSRKAP